MTRATTEQDLEIMRKLTGAFRAGITPGGVGYLEYGGGVSRTIGPIERQPAATGKASPLRVRKPAAA